VERVAQADPLEDAGALAVCRPGPGAAQPRDGRPQVAAEPGEGAGVVPPLLRAPLLPGVEEAVLRGPCAGLDDALLPDELLHRGHHVGELLNQVEGACGLLERAVLPEPGVPS